MYKGRKPLSKRADFLLYNLAAQTHPDQEFVVWVQSEDKNMAIQESELLEAGFVKVVDGGNLVPTKIGLDYLKRSPMQPNIEVGDLLRQIKNVIPRNPSFDHIAENLTDTALMRAFYTLLGEIGRRGDPDQPEKYAYWLQKCKDLEAVITGAEPNMLWERHNKQKDNY